MTACIVFLLALGLAVLVLVVAIAAIEIISQIRSQREGLVCRPARPTHCINPRRCRNNAEES